MRKDVQVLVIGAGAAGSVAAGVLAQKGLEVMIIDKVGGSTLQSSGAVDVDWQLFDEKSLGSLASALETFKFLTSDVDLQGREGNKNQAVVTQAGTVKYCALAQKSQAFDLSFLQDGDSICLLGFEDLDGFDAKSVAKVLQWSIKAMLGKEVRVDHKIVELGFSKSRWRSPMEMALYLDKYSQGQKFIESLSGAAADFADKYKACLIPPVLGSDSYLELVRDMKQKMTTPFFEMVATPHSMPGMRLKNALEKGLESLAVKQVQGEVVSYENTNHGIKRVLVKTHSQMLDVRPKCVILCTGRFFSGGFERQGLRREKIFGLPLWYKNNLIDDAHISMLSNNDRSGEQPIFSCGLKVDQQMRPLNRRLELFAQNLRAAGSSIGGYDASNCPGGLGLALFTGYMSAFHTAQSIFSE